MLVEDFCVGRGSSLPGVFLECIPRFCGEPNCGYPMEVSEVLTQLRCSNPRCPAKVVQRLLAMAKSLGVKGFGKEQVDQFVNKFGITNPLFIFGYEPETDGVLGAGVSMEVSKDIARQFADRNRFTVAEYVQVANLPFIQASAQHIFGEYASLVDAYSDIEAGSVGYIQKKLGVSVEGGLSVRALKVYDSLMQFKGDLFDGLDFVEILNVNTTGLRNLVVVCAGQVDDSFSTKDGFYAEVKSRCKTIHVEFKEAAIQGMDYLVWSGVGAETGNVRKVKAWNAMGSNIPIVTAQEFITILDRIEGA